MKRRAFSLALTLAMVLWPELNYVASALSAGERARHAAANAPDDPEECTIVIVGKAATADGSAMITHNDDSTDGDYRLVIVPEQDWPEGASRNIVADSHNYEGGTLVGKIPQVKHTFRYFHSRYSFMNEMGVAMGESTFSPDNSEYGRKVRQVMYRDGDGLIDCWMGQDVALERASTAREAIRIMGDLVEKFGWLSETGGGGETIDITDGNETWAAEFYGRDIWAAVRIPDDHFFVAANRARIGEVNLKDTENVMASPHLVSFAVEQGWYDPKAGKPFAVNKIYAPNDRLYSTRREWRALSLVAPSLKLDPDAADFPLSVKPERKLTVEDVWKIKADYYQGTPYDMSKGPAAGPWGDPLRYANSGGGGAFERSINLHRTLYLHIAQVKNWLPAPFRGISWFGYGAADTTYLTPLWPIMRDLPRFYSKGTRYEPFQRDSGWWTNSYVQQMAELHYKEASEDIHAFRAPRMQMLFAFTPKVQEMAAELYKTDRAAAINLISEFAYSNAVAWHEDWLALGDMLLGKYALGYVNFKQSPYPQWWNDLIGFKPITRGKPPTESKQQ
jgi:dipeptidase